MVHDANRRNIALHIDVADDTPKIWGDPVRLRQIVLNLADNAVKFTQEGGEVFLTAAPGELQESQGVGVGAALFGSSRPAVVLQVRDTGIGIEEGNLPRIFDAFYQIDAGTTRIHGGAGLGLSIVKQLVDGHAGEIQVQSTLGEGTLFTVKLPAADDDAR